MEIVDELMTPGCPQCAIKHLSAALTHGAMCFAVYRRTGIPTPVPKGYRVTLARAYVNLGEVLIGYKSHLWFAVGLLQMAEELAQCKGDGDTASVARAARLTLEERGLDAARDAMRIIHDGTFLGYAEMEAAHVAEARRELPENDGDYLDYERAIERIRNEFFVSEEAPAASTERAEKGGESEMATKKAVKKAPAFLKKEDPKAKQAACKGGKSKKCK